MDSFPKVEELGTQFVELWIFGVSLLLRGIHNVSDVFSNFG